MWLSVCVEDETRLGPVVLLGPSDVVLHKPIVVSFEHCAAVRQGRWTMSVFADRQTYSDDDDDLRLTHWQVCHGVVSTASIFQPLKSYSLDLPVYLRADQSAAEAAIVFGDVRLLPICAKNEKIAHCLKRDATWWDKCYITYRSR